jgi:cyclase
VKTVQFEKGKYVGDPLNAVRIFNEKEVDEIMVMDIDATVKGREPDYRVIRSLAAECRMPLCYGGGVNSVEHYQRLVSLGVEKVAISAAALENPRLISDAAEKVGSQSVTVVMDVRCGGGSSGYTVYTHNGTQRRNVDAIEFARKAEDMGAGEIVVNSIDHDGMMNGYDFQLLSIVRSAIRLPMTVLGGAGSLHDVAKVIERFGIIGVAAGSLFVFKGTYRAVLINYPNRNEKDALLRSVAY